MAYYKRGKREQKPPKKEVKTRYSRHGHKIQTTISEKKFGEIMKSTNFKKHSHKSYVACLYYFGLRASEALALTADLFSIDGNKLVIEVPKRLKGGAQTPPLDIRLNRPFVRDILITLKDTIQDNPNGSLWKFHRMTAWRIMVHAFNKYPHWLRLNRITKLFSPTPTRPAGYSTREVKRFTGLTLKALDYYVGIAEVGRIGDEL